MKPVGIKNINIQLKCSYSPVTAYEFETLKTEVEIQNLLKQSSIYVITQRPIMYIDNLTISDDGVLDFYIDDDTDEDPLECKLDLVANRILPPVELEPEIKIGFHDPNASKESPYKRVAAFQTYNNEGEFLFWLTPQKIIHHFLTGRIEMDITGNLIHYLTYKIHYIGKAFAQDIWKRLTGHSNLQSILTKEWTQGKDVKNVSFELVLFLMDIIGYDEVCYRPYYGVPGTSGTPVEHDIEDPEDLRKFFAPFLDPGAEALTVEAEALFINKYKPEYNEVKFDNYPYIKSGARDAGYTDTYLTFEEFIGFLYTDHYNPITKPKI